MRERRLALARVVPRSWIVPVVTLLAATMLAATMLGGCVVGPGYPRYGARGSGAGYDHGEHRAHDGHGGSSRDSPDHRYDDR